LKYFCGYERSSGLQNYIEPGSESEGDDDIPKIGNFYDAHYQARTRVPTIPVLTKAKNTQEHDKTLVKALEKLKCTEDDMRQIFNTLRIPYCPDRKKTPKGVGHYSAS
jgi:hypothetical protein